MSSRFLRDISQGHGFHLNYFLPVMRNNFHLLNAEHKAPDCLAFELEAQSLVSLGALEKFKAMLGIKKSLKHPQKASLVLTIQFNQERIDVFGGSLKFGFKRGELRLSLNNCRMLLASRELGAPFEVFSYGERQQIYQSEDSTSLEGSVSSNLPGIKAGLANKSVRGKVDKFSLLRARVHGQGSQEKPAWVFEKLDGEPCLRGLLKQTPLGHVSLEPELQGECYIEAIFEVRREDLFIQADGLWPRNISENKRAMIENLIALQVLRPKFVPFVSRVVLQYAK